MTDNIKPHRTILVTRAMVKRAWPSACKPGLKSYKPVRISTDPESPLNIRLALQLARLSGTSPNRNMRTGLFCRDWPRDRFSREPGVMAGRTLTRVSYMDTPSAMVSPAGCDAMQIQQMLAELADILLSERGL